ncbi:CCA tRNA nucleotidyltransferase [Paenibacillus sp. OV219]|uniref:CCA tRNA nucleotidyltransferase n=1 Tax=Paenibacillus sp. OV219 TaxID=1884377 RepID=UPI0008CE8F3F|nr:CCA tRNA nucleotidyltransferase [Paenibacillus sp. OV219]SEN26723.1 tRNA nucleotidyltransferase (CCA-adding enzyme) [Paenibacillus sp. OV219]
MSWSDALTKALPLLHVLEERGFEAVFVGGCVRDTLLGKALKDVDIATSAAPEEVIAAFPHTIPTGLQHGTVTVVHDGETYEITTFRTESAYEQFRRPTQVQFVTSLEADLLRRDFTINSMAMRADGTVVDPFGGLADLRRGVLRCVGDADARLQEDALRIVRAVRFAAAYKLRIAHGTWRAILRHRGLLVHIAMERIGLELDKMIGGSGPQHAAALLAVSELLVYTKVQLPEPLTAAAARYRADKLGAPRTRHTGEPSSATQHTQQVAIRALIELAQPEDRWAALGIALLFTEEQGAELFATLKYATARSAQLAAVIGLHRKLTSCCDTLSREQLSDQWVRLIVGKYGIAAARSCLRIMRAIAVLMPSLMPLSSSRSSSQSPKATTGEELLAELELRMDKLPAVVLKDLAVRGSDVQALQKGRPAGPWLGQTMNELLLAAALGEVQNEKQPLLNYAAQIVAIGFAANEEPL